MSCNVCTVPVKLFNVNDVSFISNEFIYTSTCEIAVRVFVDMLKHYKWLVMWKGLMALTEKLE